MRSLIRATVILCLAAAGCAEPPPSVESTALGLFEPLDPADPTRLVDRFLAAAPDDPTLLEALDRVARLGDPRVIAVEPLDGPDERAVDLEVSLEAGGSATVSVHLRADDSGVWRVTWFHGPGFGWPSGPTPGSSRATLSTSASP